MTILRGKNLLDRLRRKIQNENYGFYEEINEAQTWIANRVAFNWLRKSNIVGAGLQADVKEYDLNVGNVRSIQAIWIGAATSTSIGDVLGLTLSGTSVVSVNISAHGRTSGAQVIFSSILGTTELNDTTFKITVTDADNFTLNGTDSSDFTAYVSGGEASVWSTEDATWTLMTESPAQLFEKRVRATSNQVNNVNTGTVSVVTSELDSNRVSVSWTYYLKSGDSNPFMKFVVSPTPSKTYKIRVDFIRNVTEISEDTIPDIPVAHINSLINLAAGFILETSDQEAQVIRGLRYIKRSKEDVQRILLDSHANRAGSIDRPPAPWKV